MAARIDLVKQVFGRLTVLEEVCDRNAVLGRREWRCECTCGVQVVVQTTELTANRVTSCGARSCWGRTGPASDWTDERIVLLKRLWIMEGLSAGQVAARIGGVTRSAVLGKIHRLGLWRDTPTSKKQRIRTARLIKARNDNKPSSAPKRERASAALFNAEPFKEAVEDVIVPPEERRGVVALSESSCRWPIGDPLTPDFHFCNREHVAGLPYCETHSRRAFLPPQAKSRPFTLYHTAMRRKVSEEVS